MVVTGSQMLGRIAKVWDLKNTESAGHIRRHGIPNLISASFHIVQIVRGDRGIVAAPPGDEIDFCDLPVVLSFLVAETTCRWCP
jgi:hypothetical protein